MTIVDIVSLIYAGVTIYLVLTGQLDTSEFVDITKISIMLTAGVYGYNSFLNKRDGKYDRKGEMDTLPQPYNIEEYSYENNEYADGKII